jgi:hypothetical protein
MITKFEAIQSLQPTASFSEKDGVITWIDASVTQPSDSEIQAEITRLQNEYDSKAYSRDRATAYASLPDQLDMLFWDKMNGTEIWKNNIIKIKEKFPKE